MSLLLLFYTSGEGGGGEEGDIIGLADFSMVTSGVASFNCVIEGSIGFEIIG